MTVGGAEVGTVQSIDLGEHGEALVTFSVDSDYAPLREGTTAQVRSTSLSSVAGRQVALTLPPSNAKGGTITDGGTIPIADTISEVDLDQVFNTLSPKTINDFKHVIQGFDISYSGVGAKANEGLNYTNPFLSTTRRVFDELTLDTPTFERLLVDTSQPLRGAGRASPRPLASDPQPEPDDGRAGLPEDGARRDDRKAAAASCARPTPPSSTCAPPSTTSPRSSTPQSPSPIACGPFFKQFRGAARDAVPTIRSLDAIVSRSGPQNDLTELTRDAVPLARAGVGSGSPDCGQNPATDYSAAADGNFTQGALGESTCALTNGLPALAFFRPYTPELVGWFNDFGTSGDRRRERRHRPYRDHHQHLLPLHLRRPPAPAARPPRHHPGPHRPAQQPEPRLHHPAVRPLPRRPRA